jgi:hypothetical protein
MPATPTPKPTETVTSVSTPKPVDPTPTPPVTPTTPPPTEKPAEPVVGKWPHFTGPKVDWDDSIYQLIIDQAEAAEHIVYKVVVTPNKVMIYLGAQWPVMSYTALEFSEAGMYLGHGSVMEQHGDYFWSSYYNSRVDIINAYTEVANQNAKYDKYKDNDKWSSIPPGFEKYPWEYLSISFFSPTC